MTRDDIIRMAREAGADEHYVSDADDIPWSVEFSLTNLETFISLVEQNLIQQGYRQCAKGQRTTQFCGLLQDAVLAEREACARLVEPNAEHKRDASWGYRGGDEGVELLDELAMAIRARSKK